MLLSVLIVLVAQFSCIQGDFGIILKDIECALFDAKYCTEPDIWIDGHSGIFFNMTLLKPIPSTTKAHFVMIGASMGEYIVNTGIDVEMPFCDTVNEPVIMGPLLQIFGFSADNCPPQPGVYGSEGYVPRNDLFPDSFLPNQYKIVFKIIIEDNDVFIINMFADVQ